MEKSQNGSVCISMIMASTCLSREMKQRTFGFHFETPLFLHGSWQLRFVMPETSLN